MNKTKKRQKRRAIKYKEGAADETTESLSAPELERRGILYKSLMAVCGALLVAIAIAAHIYKTGKCEVLPVIRCRPELSVEFRDVWSSIKSCCARFKACFSRGIVSAHSTGSRYARVDQELEQTERQQVSAEVSTQPQSHGQSEVIKGKVGVSDLESAKQGDKKIKDARQKRRLILSFFFLGYIALCTVTPNMNMRHTSCSNGFFWEDHIPFGLGFFVSKMVELLLYVSDPSLDGQLPLWKFMFAFLPSFLGFVDAYQDYTSTIIAHQCSDDLNFSNRELAGMLANSMTWSFWLGVFAMQWMFLGAFAMSGDSSGALIAKLLHMDSLALCITVPEEDLWKMRAVNMIRTIGEDVPQALQQTLFVLYVKPNVFMVISIAFSVMCSCKAAYDAITRPRTAAGHEELMEKYRAERLEKIKEAKAQGSSAEQLIEGGYLREELLEAGFELGNLIAIGDLVRIFNVQGYLKLEGETPIVGAPELGQPDVWQIESTSKPTGAFLEFGEDVQLRISEGPALYLDVANWAERPNKVYKVGTYPSGDRDNGSGTWKILPVDASMNENQVHFDTPLHLLNQVRGYSSKEAVLDFDSEDGLLTADSRRPTSGSWVWKQAVID